MPVIAPPLCGMAASDEPSELDSSDARSDSGSDSDIGRQPLAMRDAPVVAGPTAQASPPRSSGRTSNDPVQQVPPATAPLPAAPELPLKMRFHYCCLLVIIPYPLFGFVVYYYFDSPPGKRETLYFSCNTSEYTTSTIRIFRRVAANCSLFHRGRREKKMLFTWASCENRSGNYPKSH